MVGGSFPGSLLHDGGSTWIYAWNDVGWSFHVCIIIFNGQISHCDVSIFGELCDCQDKSRRKRSTVNPDRWLCSRLLRPYSPTNITFQAELLHIRIFILSFSCHCPHGMLYFMQSTYCLRFRLCIRSCILGHFGKSLFPRKKNLGENRKTDMCKGLAGRTEMG